MSGCNNCFNNCVQITSDQCVKYTGPAIAGLEIEVGDPLSEVLEKLIEYLTGALDGTLIEPIIDPADLCTLINTYLTGDTLNDVISAILQSLYDLQTQITADVANMTTLNADYVVGCLPTVTNSSDTHAVVQAIIAKLCALNTLVLGIQSSLNNYMTEEEVEAYITEWYNTIQSTKYYTKMIPYTVVEYYGNLTGFPTGADGFTGDGIGYGYWENIYLCNGEHGTPDKRGRIGIGCTSGMGGGALSPTISPYSSNAPMQVYGNAVETLSIAQMPAHNHVVPAPTVNDPGHRHVFASDPQIADATYTRYGILPTGSDSSSGGAEYYTKSELGVNNKASQTTGITVSIPATENKGNTGSHNNIPPVISAWYIMYIPPVVPCP